MTVSKSTLFPHSFFRGRIVASEEACVHISSHSLQYGSTCFGGLRLYHRETCGRIVRLRDHHQRLMTGCRILGLDYSIHFEEFRDIITKLVQVNFPKCDCYLRPAVITEGQLVAPRFDGLEFDLAIYMIPMGQFHDLSTGLRLMISSWRKFSDSAIPTKAKAGGCYLNSSLAMSEARRCGYDDALLMDHEGHIAEASVANMLLVYGGEVILPQLGSPLLDGITMRTMVEFLRLEGVPVRFEQIDRSMVYSCDELILTGTAAQVLFVQSVDDRPIGEESTQPGPLCRMLRERFAELIDMRHPRSEEWMTEIPLGPVALAGGSQRTFAGLNLR